jgi:hypothetical protein
MTKWSFLFRLFILIWPVGLVIYLVAAASSGNDAAIFALGVLAAVVLVSLGAAIAIAVMSMSHQREQSSFRDNVSENLAILNTVLRAQNAQNEAIAWRIKGGGYLPPLDGDDPWMTEEESREGQ